MKVIIIGIILWWIAQRIEARRQNRRITRIQETQTAALQRQQQAEREQMRLAKEQERQQKELSRQREMITKLEQRVQSAEADLSFYREQRDKLFDLLKVEEDHIAGCVEGGKEWAKHQQKIISLECKIHATQKRIDKAQEQKYNSEQKLTTAA